jgi:hypothetical protein
LRYLLPLQNQNLARYAYFCAPSSCWSFLSQQRNYFFLLCISAYLIHLIAQSPFQWRDLYVDKQQNLNRHQTQLQKQILSEGTLQPRKTHRYQKQNVEIRAAVLIFVFLDHQR